MHKLKNYTKFNITHSRTATLWHQNSIIAQEMHELCVREREREREYVHQERTAVDLVEKILKSYNIWYMYRVLIFQIYIKGNFVTNEIW